MTQDRKMETGGEARQRSARTITLVTLVIMTVISAVTLLFVPASDKTPIDNFMMPFVALAAAAGYYFARRGRSDLGVYLLLAAIGVTVLIYPMAADNIGWQTAIGMILVATGIANSALPEKAAGRVITAAFGFAIAIILIELFTTGAVRNPVTPSSIVVIILLALVYVGITLYRFRQFGLRTKFIIVFVLLSVFSVSATAVTISSLVSDQLKLKVEQQLTGVSELTATAIGRELVTQISVIQAAALSESLQSALVRREAQSNIVELLKLDEQWRAADAAKDDDDPLVRKATTGALADQLRALREEFPAHVEIFIADVYGANVAATNRTTDYYQADEEWWQVAYSNGEGAVYLSQPAFDESSGSFSIQVALPIFDNHSGAMLGIIRSTLDLSVFIPSLELGKPGETGRTEIYMPGNLELELHVEDGQPMLETETSPADFASTLAGQPHATFLDTVHDGSPVMAGITDFTGSGVENPEISEAFELLNWHVVTLQDRSEALQAVEDTSRAAQLVGLAALVLASLAAVGITRFITRPILSLTETAEEISTGNLNAVARVESPDEVGELAKSFNRTTAQLRDTLSNLEQRIEERTYDLEVSRRQTEHRAAQYIAIGEISKLINSEQELNILLPLIARLVSERFGFYHTGIFLLDDTGQYAVLLAANSAGGQNMLKRGHRLKVGESGIVGAVGKTGLARIAFDVGQDAVFFDNPDLPDTRSEAAVPLKVRDAIIGVLDVQSEKPGAFTEDDTNMLGILADQIAIAIENTRLLEQTRQALTEARLTYQRTLHEGWKSLIEDEDMIGYRQSMSGGRRLTKPVVSDEISQAMNRGSALVFHADGKTDDPTMVVPIKLRDQIIGVLRIKSPSRERPWTADEINLAEAISDRLSLALENARLLQEFQRQAVKEQTIAEITGKIGSSINLNNVLLTAVEELGRTIPGSEVTIKLKDESGNNGNG